LHPHSGAPAAGAAHSPPRADGPAASIDPPLRRDARAAAARSVPAFGQGTAVAGQQVEYIRRREAP
jgi:hypothetical protein